MSDRGILMVAFHYPPLLASSGWLRTAAFARYLPDYGWKPIVLTANPRAYWATASEHLSAVASIETHRAFALDAARHLGIGGKYPLLLALPDRWISWLPAAVLRGLRIIRQRKPRVIWSTFPIPSALAIGLCLHRLSGLPWIVDLRDVMVDADFPERHSERRLYAWLEGQAVSRAAAVVLTAPGAARLYRDRYPEVPAERFQVILNGYNELDFAAVENALAAEQLPAKPGDGELRLVHSGLLSAVDRNPEAFFVALQRLRARHPALARRLRIVLRGAGGNRAYRSRIEELGIADMVELAAAVSYHEALREVLLADGLLLFQGATCNHAIPAKLFEYFRSGRPILALTDSRGDTAGLLVEEQAAAIADIDSAEDICTTLAGFCESILAGRARPVAEERVRRYSRNRLTGDLAALLDRIAEPGPA